MTESKDDDGGHGGCVLMIVAWIVSGILAFWAQDYYELRCHVIDKLGPIPKKEAKEKQ